MVKGDIINVYYEKLGEQPAYTEIKYQVEDFIKEFFDEEDKPLEKRDFLEEFFAELDDKDESAYKKE